jgi:S-DNA-T family DNA segregation ATPase FtsK/SpoIIIE
MLRLAPRPLLIALALAIVAVGSLGASAHAQAIGKSVADAASALDAGDLRRAATLARMAGDRASGVDRDAARYLEGYALFRLSEFTAAASVLRTATSSQDRYIAAQANVTLGSAEIELRRWDAAGHAYRRAAGFLSGAAAVRAHSVAARCFDQAGMAGLAASEREAAGEPTVATQDGGGSSPQIDTPKKPVKGEAGEGAGSRREPRQDVDEAEDEDTAEDTAQDATADAGEGDARQRLKAVEPAKPSQPRPATPRSVVPDSKQRVTEDDRPARNEVAKVRYAIQVGAFSTSARAAQCADELRAKCRQFGIEAPRVVSREGADGKVLHIVQMGQFPNRGAAGKAQLRFPPNAYKIEPYLTDGDQPG